LIVYENFLLYFSIISGTRTKIGLKLGVDFVGGLTKQNPKGRRYGQKSAWGVFFTDSVYIVHSDHFFSS